MATSVISTFGDREVARKAMHALREAGVPERNVELLEGEEEQIVAEMVGRGFARDEAREFARATRQGKMLVAARVADEEADRALAIMERYESSEGEDEDEDSRGAERGTRRRAERGETVPVVEEELEARKRKVANGGVRVTSSVAETPVQATVRLREERVEVDRQPVDREASSEERDRAFQEKTVEMMGTEEQVEVAKEARVVEEVSLRKNVQEHEETVRDTVRRTEVEVEEIGPKARKSR